MRHTKNLNCKGLATTALVAALASVITSCQPTPAATVKVAGVATDTFAVSNNPSSKRSNDVVMRVMNSQGKEKIAYLSFAISSKASSLSAKLRLTPRQSGFRLQVRNSSPVSDSITYSNRPTLGSTVGDSSDTRANTHQSISLNGVKVQSGRVHLAVLTTSPYELEIVSKEGASSKSAAASLEIGGSTPPPNTTPPPTVPPSPPGWKLSFSDEFSGSSVDSSKWNVYDENSVWNSVESPKAMTCPKASNVSVNDGKLVMRTQKSNGTCKGGQAQSGAGLNTWGLFDQAQGRFSARVRWTDRGNYLWGGFWTHANGGSGYDKSKGSELDIFEYIGKVGEPNIKRYKPAIHYNYTCNPKCMSNVPVMGIDVTQWHEYSVEWGPTSGSDPESTQIRFFLDGKPTAQFDSVGTWSFDSYGNKVLQESGAWTNPNAPFPYPFGLDRKHKIILSAWVGAPGTDASTVANGYRPAAGHADLQVDWVRVYKR